MRLFVALGLAGLAGVAIGAQEPTEGPADAPAPEEELASDRLDSLEQLDARLEALVAEHGRWLDLRRLQRGGDGPTLHLAVLGERESGDPSRRPGLVVLPELATADGRTSEALLGALERLCAELAEEAEGGGLRRLLSQVTVYVLPAPRSDVFVPRATPRWVALDRNFPSGWRPATGGETGPYPLSEPESLALADFLHWRANLAACFEVSGQAPFATDEPGAADAADARRAAELAEALGALGAEEPIVLGLDDLAAPPGSLRRYADRCLGLWTFLQAPSNAAVADQFAALEHSAAESTRMTAGVLVERIVGLARALPRLELGALEIERLGEGLWRIDVPVRNVGRMSTGGRHRAEPTARVRLEVGGAELVATMVRGVSRESFTPLNADGSRIDLGHLDGGTNRVLRAIVRAEPDARLTLEARSARGGVVATVVALPDR